MLLLHWIQVYSRVNATCHSVVRPVYRDTVRPDGVDWNTEHLSRKSERHAKVGTGVGVCGSTRTRGLLTRPVSAGTGRPGRDCWVRVHYDVIWVRAYRHIPGFTRKEHDFSQFGARTFLFLHVF